MQQMSLVNARGILMPHSRLFIPVVLLIVREHVLQHIPQILETLLLRHVIMFST